MSEDGKFTPDPFPGIRPRTDIDLAMAGMPHLPHLAEVKSIYTTERHESVIAAGLRELADQIEANQLPLGAIERIAVVYSNDDGEGITAFGDIKGDADVYYLFGLAQRCVIDGDD